MNSTYWLNKIMDTMYTSAATEFWVGLSSTMPAQNGTGVSEPTGGNYARVQITEFTDPVNGTIKNVSALEFNRSSAVWFDSDHKAKYWVLFDGSTADATLMLGMILDVVREARAEKVCATETEPIGEDDGHE